MNSSYQAFIRSAPKTDAMVKAPVAAFFANSLRDRSFNTAMWFLLNSVVIVAFW